MLSSAYDVLGNLSNGEREETNGDVRRFNYLLKSIILPRYFIYRISGWLNLHESTFLL